MLEVGSRNDTGASWIMERGANVLFKTRPPNKFSNESRFAPSGYQVKARADSTPSFSPGSVSQVAEKANPFFQDKKRVRISNLPKNITEKDLQDLFGRHNLQAIRIEAESALAGLSQLASAENFVQEWNGHCYDGQKLQVQLAPLDSLLFVGNVPSEFSEKELKAMFTPFGEVCRAFIIHSPISGQSKCYGMVEFVLQEQALRAKQKLAMKCVGGRTLRVDCIDSVLETPTDLQSATLFVDQLPKGFRNNDKLKEIFSKYGHVSFCQIALSSNSGAPRGFGFVDMATWQEAEKAQAGCNGMLLGNSKMRVSFGMPGRPGSIILQAKQTKQQSNVSIPIRMSSITQLQSAQLQQAQLQPSQLQTTQLQPPQVTPQLQVPGVLAPFQAANSQTLSLPFSTITTLPFPLSHPVPTTTILSSSSGSSSSESSDCFSPNSLFNGFHCSDCYVAPRKNGLTHKVLPPPSTGVCTTTSGTRSNAKLRGINSSSSSFERSSGRSSSITSSTDSDVSDENSVPSTSTLLPPSHQSSSLPPTSLLPSSLLSASPENTQVDCFNNGVPHPPTHPLQHNNTQGLYCTHCGMTARPRKRQSLNESMENVYDKPFVRQHQQGIRFVHPTKRLKE